MPIAKTPVNGSFYAQRTLHSCKATSYTAWTTFLYDSYEEVYNDPQHRIKPDPLDETSLAKQTKRRLKPSIVPWHNYLYQRDWSCPGGPYTWIQKRTKGIAEYAPTFPPYTLDWQSDVLEHIAEQYTNIGDSLAEYRATANQFLAYGRGLKQAWTRFRRFKRFKTRLTPCSIPAAELAYSFGVAPLVEDLYSATEALRLRLESPIYVDFFKTATAHAKQTYSQSGYSDCSRRLQVSNRVEGTVQLEPVQVSNLAFGNPTTWGWELIPFSFVVDWGIPIGQWLQNLDMLRRIDSVSGTRSIKEQYTSYWRRSGVFAGGSASYEGSLGKLSYKSHERKVLSAVPVPPLPRWKPSLSWHKVYRALTLLVAVNQPCSKVPHSWGLSRRRP